MRSLINGKLKKGDRRGERNRAFSLENPASGEADALGLEHLLLFVALLPGVAESDAEARLPVTDDMADLSPGVLLLWVRQQG